MDAVITYVDGRDPLWQQDYASVVGGEVLTKRYRDWGTLKYLLRGIQKHIPSVRNVYLVVSRDSQVPEWVNRENLHIVFHSDIIPSRFLPTFSSGTIEMFLHRIPGLAEEFLYFNDDMFPVMDCVAEDFFVDGKSAIGFSRHLLVSNEWKRRVRNSDRQARLCLGMKAGLTFVRPQHTTSPMLRSQNEKIYGVSKDKIFQVAAPLRTDDSFNQYLYLDYLYYQGKATGRGISHKHLSPAVYSAGKICRYIESPTAKMICINDVQMPQERFEHYRSMIAGSLERHFPEKSRFER